MKQRPIDHPHVRAHLETLVRAALSAIGEDPDRPGLVDTPRRWVKALAEMTGGLAEDAAAPLERTFPDRFDEMVLVRGIHFTSLCEHHLLPFTGTADVAYIPGDVVVGLSKIPRMVEIVARRPQVQERMTSMIAEVLQGATRSRGVGVTVRAEHTCCSARGVRSRVEMVTHALLGVFKEDPATRAEFLGK